MFVLELKRDVRLWRGLGLVLARPPALAWLNSLRVPVVAPLADQNQGFVPATGLLFHLVVRVSA